MKVCKTINLRTEDFQLVTLHPGDEVPAWAESLITNPRVILVEAITADSAGDAIAEAVEELNRVDYSTMTAKELKPLLKERGLPTSGSVSELRERLAEADAAASEPAEDVDVFDMTREQLEAHAAEKGVEFSADTSDEELATLLDEE